MDIEKAIQGIRGTSVAHLEPERIKGMCENTNELKITKYY
jgi:hypothetical protein